MKDLKNKIVIVTGANIGLGYETALQLAGAGATVIMACRSDLKAFEAKQKILGKYPGSDIHCMKLDLSSQTSVRAFSIEFKKLFSHLHLLINNAGIMMPSYKLTDDGFESQLATNYIGHFALTGRLMPHLLKTPHSRVVTLSSLAHNWSPIQITDLHFKNGYNKQKAYGQSKLACLMYAYELDRRLKAAGVQTISVAAHPGLSNTNLSQHLPLMMRILSPILGQSPAAGAQTTIYAALADHLNGGEYIGPGGFKEWYGKPIPVNSGEASKNKLMAKALWDLSEQMTGIKYAFVKNGDRLAVKLK